MLLSVHRRVMMVIVLLLARYSSAIEQLDQTTAATRADFDNWTNARLVTELEKLAAEKAKMSVELQQRERRI